MMREVDEAVRAAVAGAGVTTGLARAPVENPPYAIVYPQTAPRWGSLGNPTGSATAVVQVTCVGSGPEQARWVADKASTAVEAMRQTAAGSYVVTAEKLDDGAVIRDDDVQPPEFAATPRFRLFVTPA